MKAKYIYDINDTLVFLNDYLKDKLSSYDDIKKYIVDIDRQWTMEITYTDDDDEYFDFTCGNMGFTIYKNEDGSARLCENATYYYYDSDNDIQSYDIEL